MKSTNAMVTLINIKYIIFSRKLALKMDKTHRLFSIDRRGLSQGHDGNDSRSWFRLVQTPWAWAHTVWSLLSAAHLHISTLDKLVLRDFCSDIVTDKISFWNWYQLIFHQCQHTLLHVQFFIHFLLLLKLESHHPLN